MTLNDLKGIIGFTFDLTDNEIDARFYIELDEIKNKRALDIEVVKIERDVVTCKLTDFLRRVATFAPSDIVSYLSDNYNDGEQKDYLIKQLTKRKCGSNKGDVTDDGGDAVWHFINYDMYDFITKE
jgi:hypothetical protein